jgi:hypothetical protein
MKDGKTEVQINSNSSSPLIYSDSYNYGHSSKTLKAH